MIWISFHFAVDQYIDIPDVWPNKQGDIISTYYSDINSVSVQSGLDEWDFLLWLSTIIQKNLKETNLKPAVTENRPESSAAPSQFGLWREGRSFPSTDW